MNRFPALTTLAAAAILLAGCASTSSTAGGNTEQHPPTATSHAGTPSSPTPTNTFTLPIPGPTHLAPATQRHKAAGILRAEVAYYRGELNKGLAVMGTSDYTAWYTVAVNDAKPEMDALGKVNACFTADDQPPTLDDWSSINFSGDLATVAGDGLGVGAPGGDADARAKVKADQQQMEADLKHADDDANLIELGK